MMAQSKNTPIAQVSFGLKIDYTPIEAAAIAWWEMLRPVEWTLEQHLENPTINTVTEAERNLATVVARLVSVS